MARLLLLALLIALASVTSLAIREPSILGEVKQIIGLKKHDDLRCCSAKDCSECFQRQVDKDKACGFKSLWCGCHMEDCGGTLLDTLLPSHHKHDDELKCCSAQDCSKCFNEQLKKDPQCGLKSPWCGCHEEDCGDDSVVNSHKEHEDEDELKCCSAQDCTDCFNEQLKKDPGCGLKSPWCGCHEEDCGDDSVSNSHNKHDDELKCCSANDCTDCFNEQLKKDPGCGLKSPWCGCHQEDCGDDSVSNSHKEHDEEDELTCCSAQDCSNCFNEQLKKDPKCGLKSPWCGCHEEDCDENKKKKKKQKKGKKDPLRCCGANDCTECFNAMIKKDPACGFKSLWCGCHKEDCDTVEDTFSFRSHHSDELKCCSASDCTNCFNEQLKKDPGCGLKSAWCGCHQEDCGDDFVANSHKEHEDEDKLKCCSAQDCSRCFNEQLKKDPKCGLKSPWCGCHEEDCGDDQNVSNSHKDDDLKCCSAKDCSDCFHEQLKKDPKCGLKSQWCGCHQEDC